MRLFKSYYEMLKMFEQNSTSPNLTPSPPWIQHHSFITGWFAIVNLLSVFGTGLNFLVFFGIVSSRKLRTGSGALIAHSIFIDGIMCAFAIPLLSVTTWIPQYAPPSTNLCRWFGWVFYGSVWASNWASVPIAANRFVALCFPHFYDKICQSKAIFAAAVIFSWTISYGCSLIFVFGIGGKFDSIQPWRGCGQAVVDPSKFSLVTAVCTSLPTVSQGVVYISLFAHTYLQKFFGRLKVTSIAASEEQTGQRLRLLALRNRRLRLTRMVFAAYVWSTVCYMCAPITLSAAPVVMKTNLYLPLIFRAFLQVGYATSPVSISSRNFPVQITVC